MLWSQEHVRGVGGLGTGILGAQGRAQCRPFMNLDPPEEDSLGWLELLIKLTLPSSNL